ncbi:MAG: methionine--tRNA ligase [Cytophagales bacterium]|nr:methionine--tRNA ligase [Cytophagales bacterium]
MDKKFTRTTVTAALIYANGPVHIGHLAGCYLPADIYVRYLRAKGEDVIFVSGTDEHGVPITIKAKNEGITPQQVVDKYYTQIKKSFEEFGISFDIYSRTSSAEHHAMSQDFFLHLYNNKNFVEKTDEQYYDQEANRFLADRYITGTCPVCANPHAYGDQCEKCGSTLSPQDLINPRSTLSGKSPVKKPTTNWYLPLDTLQPHIQKYISAHPEWKTNVLGQCKSWLSQGLQPRAMTRDLEWGVSLPIANTAGKVMYVWFDAPIGYITFTKQLCQQNAKNWEPYWKSEDTRLVHFIGKDNIVFHCIIFPAMLMQHGGYILPHQVPACEFLNLEGDKISTSRNWAIWLHEYLQDFKDKQDVLRYVLAANIPETKDSDFTWADFMTRNNSELVGILGNFVNRTLVLLHKYCEGKVPQYTGTHQAAHQDVIAKIQSVKAELSSAIEAYRFREGLNILMDLARAGNKYMADTEPWKMAAHDMDAVNSILYNSVQLCANLCIFMEPYMPFTAAKLQKMLNLDKKMWDEAGNMQILPTGHMVNEPQLLFAKLDESDIKPQIEKLNISRQAQIKKDDMETKTVEKTIEKTAISYDDFVKMDIRTATILAAERVPKTDKLLKITLDTGIDTRTVVSGIAMHYDPEHIIGKQVTLLANLEPRNIKGIESKGMILMAEDTDGKLHFVQPDAIINNGAEVR